MFERRSREDSLLIIQCDSGHLYSDLIAYRYSVDDEREKSSHLWSAKYGKTQYCTLLSTLARPGEGNSARMLGSFVGFQERKVALMLILMI